MWDLFLTAVNRCRSDAPEKITRCRPDVRPDDDRCDSPWFLFAWEYVSKIVCIGPRCYHVYPRVIHEYP